MSTSLQAIRAATEAGSAEQKRMIERKRNIIVLIYQHLVECGYLGAAETLMQEAGVAASKFEVADNMDLNLILSEFEAYYELKFDKKPKVVRKINGVDDVSRIRPPRQPDPGTKRAVSRTKSDGGKHGSGDKLPTVSGASPPSASNSEGMDGVSVRGSSVNASATKTADDDVDKVENRLLRPPPQFGMDSEMKQLAGVISREIYQDSPNVRFEDIVSLDEAKRLLCEAVQLPLRFPTVFQGLLRPWKGILLHGPPGTGKTMLAKAVATECRTTFFNISASTLVSKWRGDSEKLVRALFEVARYHAPSTIFLDEMDSILSARGGEGGSEHEASRRMKTELLMQMDGLRASKASEQVFVMAASNLPWDLDVAVLRRLEKRVMVPLPCTEAREAMLRKHLQCRGAEELDYTELARMTEGYSGADLELLCREAAMKPVRRLMERLKSIPEESLPAPPRAVRGHKARVDLSNNSAEANMNIDAMLKADPVAAIDVREALESTKPASDLSLQTKYEQWQNEFGSV
mmetsp:Transcript_16336/g.24620  ORF Transcript_16336/g.24620 Transcript_16336/m.24620 type:complete len:519 (+) Transcript_16336:59-1615(+)|eukprot:CAMPEP_0185041490 /NCGR_PEP_ID=MMETSP1103-20130426/40856_1 /TAXON_ID=36769 /ORGANISM="Paraphysomonas bandaiensis, Strain Caron Lab Isolate" /LENGTH=518 /DNA_ID=CAMNT_0027581235 /DNA_START=57 /DNA_END=1613 /DNA_ORIENTATION=-